jgi:hypothetical protein
LCPTAAGQRCELVEKGDALFEGPQRRHNARSTESFCAFRID